MAGCVSGCECVWLGVSVCRCGRVAGYESVCVYVFVFGVGGCECMAGCECVHVCSVGGYEWVSGYKCVCVCVGRCESVGGYEHVYVYRCGCVAGCECVSGCV